MPWKAMSTMSLRKEFVTLALQKTFSFHELCRRFGISRKVGYKWLNRHSEHETYADRSRRPHNSPSRTREAIEQAVVEMRDQHPAWGGRKIRRRLLDLGVSDVPAASTITDILRRHGRLMPEESAKRKPFKRFERDEPNELWQMDFKGHFDAGGERCHPLTILDDHSRYALGVYACANERRETVEEHLSEVFRRYGLPAQILADNGSPWGASDGERFTKLEVWLMRIGVELIHGRPRHPQTQGKDERFNRTLKAEAIRYEHFSGVQSCQVRFDAWRHTYNCERPHEALGMQVPARCYRPSPRSFPQTLPAIEYGPGDLVRIVGDSGKVTFKGKKYRVGKAFRGYPVAVRPTVAEEIFDVYFCNVKIRMLDISGG